MDRLSRGRRLIKRFHPEGIPWPGAVVYNAISRTRIFQRNYELVVRDILSYGSEGSILDVGTGPGWLLIKLHQLLPLAQITGVDTSPAMVTKARKNLKEIGLSDIITVQEADASRLPFLDASFDIVVSTGSIHHWKEPVVGLNEAYRVLKPGGHALMYDVLSDTPASVLKETAKAFGRLKVLIFWLHAFEEPFYSRQNFEALATETLFKKGKTKFVGVLCCLILKREEVNG